MPTKIVLINGPSGAGKDTLAQEMSLRLRSSKNPISIMKMAEPLKLAAHAYMKMYDPDSIYTPKNIDYNTTAYTQVYGPNWYEDEHFTPCKEFFGQKPNTVYYNLAAALNLCLDDNQYNYDRVRITAHALFGLYNKYPDIVKYYDIVKNPKKYSSKNYALVLKSDFFESTKNLNSYLFAGSNPRATYIWLSEEIVKPNFTNDFFGKVFTNTLDLYCSTTLDPIVFVADSGFHEETEPVIAKYGAENCLLLRIKAEQRGKTFAGDSRSYIDLPIKTYTVYNNVNNNTDAFFDETALLLNNWILGI